MSPHLLRALVVFGEGRRVKNVSVVGSGTFVVQQHLLEVLDVVGELQLKVLLLFRRVPCHGHLEARPVGVADDCADVERITAYKRNILNVHWQKGYLIGYSGCISFNI